MHRKQIVPLALKNEGWKNLSEDRNNNKKSEG